MAQTSKQKRLIERLLILFAAAVTILLISISGELYYRVKKLNAPDHLVYGVWVEQNVAAYAAEHIELTKNGVVIEGGVVDTQFYFDGDTLEYQLGDQVIEYQFLNEEYSEMKRISGSSYQPIFRLQSKFKEQLR